MSMELLLEIPSEIVKVFPIDEESNNLNLKSATVVLLTKTVAIINSETGYIYRTYDATRGNNCNVVDCVYLKDARSLLVVLSDSTLVLIPEGAKNSKEYQCAPLPLKPVHLHTNGKDIFVSCEGGNFCQISLSTDNELPSISAPKAPATLTTNVWSAANNHTIVTAHTNTSSSSSSASKKSKKEVASSATKENVLSIATHKAGILSPGTAVWFIASQDAIRTTLPLGSDSEKLTHLVSHKLCNSTSLILCDTATGACRWVKMSITGRVLFERCLPAAPLSVVEVRDQVWLTFSASRVAQWDVRFGVEVLSHTVPSQSGGSGSVFYVLPYGYTSVTAGGDSAPSSGPLPCHYLLCVPSASKDATVVYRHVLTSDGLPPKSSLCSAVGKMSGAAGQQVNSADGAPFNVSIYDDSAKVISSEGETAVSGGRVLAGLPGPMKRKLRQIKDQHDAQVALERKENECSADVEEPAARFEKKARKFYLDVPESISRAFLTRLESAKHTDLLSSDWDLVKVLVRSGTLSLAGNPSLVSQATAANRFDVLAHIVQYVSDLTEKQCVKILHLCLFAPEESLNRVSVVGGIIVWGNKGALAEQQTAVVVADGKTPSKKKDKKGAAAVVDSTTTVGNVVDNRLVVVRAMLEAVLHRSAAFSTVLLSEAVRLLSPATCALLLRTLAFTLRGLTSPVHDMSGSSNTTSLGDDQIKRAITWMEALLDGHFSATALAAQVHAPTRVALTAAMKVVSSAEVAAEEVEATMGLWTHITRVLHSGSEQTKPIAGLYQVDHLTL